MALTDNLVSYWELGEASGDRADSHGTNTLTNGTVSNPGSAVGKIGDGVNLIRASGNWLTHASNSDLQGGDVDFSLSLWVKLSSKPSGQMFLFAKHNGSTIAGSEYLCAWNASSDRFEWTIYQGSSTSATAVADNLGAPSTGVWYHVVCTHDATANQIAITVNAGTANTASISGGSNTISTDFFMGVDAAFTATLLADAVIDEVGWWKGRVLSGGDISALYNSGAGLAYPLAAGPPPPPPPPPPPATVSSWAYYRNVY